MARWDIFTQVNHTRGNCYLFYDLILQRITYLLIHSLTHSLTPWCRILFEKLIITQLVKKILLSYGTPNFITVFTQARHWTLS
jgi:hypothetical protein